MQRSTPRRWTAAVVALLALPVTMGPGRCGFIVDFTETILITDEIDRIVLGVDDGGIWATMFDREAILIKRHTFSFEPSIGEVTSPGGAVEDGVLTLEARCKYEGNCSFDHMFELPLGIAFEATLDEALIRLGYFDSDIDLTFVTGSFKGVRLASPNVTVTAEDAVVTIDFAVPPQALTVALDAGEVTIEVPTGEYRCALPAGAKTTGITCNDAATSVLDVRLGDGDVTVTGVEP